MGYDTQFSGSLRFIYPITAAELNYLNSILGEDTREHPEWEAKDMYYLDLELTDDRLGIRWNGSEKSYLSADSINLIIKLMQKINHNFGLSGEMLAQGEEIGDIWKIVMKDNVAVQQDAIVKGKLVCPHCNKEIYA